MCSGVLELCVPTRESLLCTSLANCASATPFSSLILTMMGVFEQQKWPDTKIQILGEH